MDAALCFFTAFNTNEGSIDPKIPGRILLSVNHAGCYMVTIGVNGVAAGACCGDECVDIGAFPGTTTKRMKREMPPPPSRIMRSMIATREIDAQARDRVDVRGEEGAQNLHTQCV